MLLSERVKIFLELLAALFDFVSEEESIVVGDLGAAVEID